jgi:hypothetical protein
LSLHNVDCCHFISFLNSWGLPHLIFLWHWLLEIVTWNPLHHMIKIHFWSPSHLISWFNKDWHLEICDSSWLAWFLGLNIHLSFSVTFSASTPRLSLALLRCMVHRGQVLSYPSSTIIISHTSLHVFHRLIIENLLLMIKLLPSISNT